MHSRKEMLSQLLTEAFAHNQEEQQDPRFLEKVQEVLEAFETPNSQGLPGSPTTGSGVLLH